MEIINKQQLAELLNVNMKTVNYLVYFKKIPRVRIGKEFRFVKEEIEAWVKEKTERPLKIKFRDTIELPMPYYKRRNFWAK